MEKKSFLRKLRDFLWPKKQKKVLRPECPELSLAHDIMDKLTRGERRKLRCRLRQGAKCSSCGSLDIVGKVEYDEFLIIRWSCNGCGDYWHNFLLYGKWGWVHDKGIHDNLKKRLASD